MSDSYNGKSTKIRCTRDSSLCSHYSSKHVLTSLSLSPCIFSSYFIQYVIMKRLCYSFILMLRSPSCLISMAFHAAWIDLPCVVPAVTRFGTCHTRPTTKLISFVIWPRTETELRFFESRYSRENFSAIMPFFSLQLFAFSLSLIELVFFSPSIIHIRTGSN